MRERQEREVEERGEVAVKVYWRETESIERIEIECCSFFYGSAVQ